MVMVGLASRWCHDCRMRLEVVLAGQWSRWVLVCRLFRNRIRPEACGLLLAGFGLSGSGTLLPRQWSLRLRRCQNRITGCLVRVSLQSSYLPFGHQEYHPTNRSQRSEAAPSWGYGRRFGGGLMAFARPLSWSRRRCRRRSRTGSLFACQRNWLATTP